MENILHQQLRLVAMQGVVWFVLLVCVGVIRASLVTCDAVLSNYCPWPEHSCGLLHSRISASGGRVDWQQGRRLRSH